VFCIYCGARLPAAARFCRSCGERLEEGAGDVLPEHRPSAAAPAPSLVSGEAAPAGISVSLLRPEPAFLDTAGDAAALTLEQLVQLPRWPEQFVQEVSSVVPTLSAEERHGIEQACWSHVDSVLFSGARAGAEVDLEQIERDLMEDTLLAVLPWLEIGPELLQELHRAAT